MKVNKKRILSIVSFSIMLLFLIRSSSVVESISIYNNNRNNSSPYPQNNFNHSYLKWSTIEVVSTECSSYSFYSSAAIDSKNNIHVVWHDWTNYLGYGTDWDIFYKMWNSTTKTWSITEVVSTESTTDSSYPIIAVDSIDNVHVVWEDVFNYLSCGADQDIFYKYRNSNTQTWSALEVISTESTGHSYNPKIEIDSKDNIHIVWEDVTNYLSCGTDSDIFYKYWNDTTQAWSGTEIVSTESTNHSGFPALDV